MKPTTTDVHTLARWLQDYAALADRKAAPSIAGRLREAAALLGALTGRIRTLAARERALGVCYAAIEREVATLRRHKRNGHQLARLKRQQRIEAGICAHCGASYLQIERLHELEQELARVKREAAA